MEFEIRWSLRPSSRNLRIAAPPAPAPSRDEGLLRTGSALENTISRAVHATGLCCAHPRSRPRGAGCGCILRPEGRSELVLFRGTPRRTNCPLRCSARQLGSQVQILQSCQEPHRQLGYSCTCFHQGSAATYLLRTLYAPRRDALPYVSRARNHWPAALPQRAGLRALRSQRAELP